MGLWGVVFEGWDYGCFGCGLSEESFSNWIVGQFFHFISRYFLQLVG